jgi:hypothetical protein
MPETWGTKSSGIIFYLSDNFYEVKSLLEDLEVWDLVIYLRLENVPQ